MHGDLIRLKFRAPYTDVAAVPAQLLWSPDFDKHCCDKAIARFKWIFFQIGFCYSGRGHLEQGTLF